MEKNKQEGKKRSSGKRPKKRKFTGNIHTRPAKSVCNLNESASGKKINISANKISSDAEFKGYRIIDVNIMFSNLKEHLSCKVCGGEVIFKEEIVCGLSSKISIECSNCIQLCTFRNSLMLGPKKNIPEINRRFMYASRAIGKGHSGMKLFCGLMDFPKPVAEKSYNAMVKTLLTCTNTAAETSMKCAAAEEISLTGSSDIMISGDGTWKTRGHMSRIGVCAVIGDRSGKVIDTEVLSTFCKACDSWKTRKGTDEYKQWISLHENECLVNHTGSAGKMEVVGMCRIFERSVLKRHAKYVGYIGDGDAKTFLAITQSSPYGPNTNITKI